MVHVPRLTPGATPEGMARIPGGGFDFYTEGVEKECGPRGHADEYGCDVQMPWESHPRPTHSRWLNVSAFDIDIFPVTAGEYAAYLASSGYVPADGHNWLRNWEHSDGHAMPHLPPAIANVPVTYVSYAEAAAYCQAAGKRLPTTWEWQYAAQGGLANRSFPWGVDDDETCRPALHAGRVIPGAPPVGSYPLRCRSPCNVSDLVGHVWQYTSAFEDERTRAVLLKGGSNYAPTVTRGVQWYYPQARNLSLHNKYFLFSDSFERAGTLGFRCVREVRGL